MRFVIVTGMSGAGKSTALKMLEDAEYFCVDNLPIPLIDKFAHLTIGNSAGEVQKAALGIDIRSGQSLQELHEKLEQMTMEGIEYEILFLDASDEVLIKRYKETKKTAGEFELHRLYAQKTGSMFMTQTFEIVSNAILGMMYGTFTDILEASSGEWELESHRKIIDALRDRDTKRAQELMHDHLQRTIDLFK